MKNVNLSHAVMATVAYLAGLYGPTAWSSVAEVVRGGISRDTISTSTIGTAASSIHCHGLKRHPDRNLLFAACREGNGDHVGGLIHVIDPSASTTQRLDFEDFKGPLVAQSFDIVADPNDLGAVYIHAVNNIPTGSQIDVFRYVLGTPTIRHVRSIENPIIGRHSSLVASSPTSFYITNTHVDEEPSASGSTHLEDIGRWSNIIHVEMGNLKAATNPSKSITTSIAFTGSTNDWDINQGMTEEELDYPLEWLTGDDVPACALSAQKAVSSSRLMKLRDCVRLAAGISSKGF